MQSNRELVLYYTDVDGRLVRIFLPLLFGVFAAGGLWLLFLWVTALPSATMHVVMVGLVLWPGTLLFSWLTARLAVAAWRSGHRHWWLRLSSTGFEVNDRIFAARRYDWREIDKFMLVAPSDQIENAVVVPGKTFTEVLKAGPAQLPGHSAWASIACQDIAHGWRTGYSAACVAPMGPDRTVWSWASGTGLSTRRSI